jgi:hypothetical protein
VLRQQQTGGSTPTAAVRASVAVAWERRCILSYDYSLRSDERICPGSGCTTWLPNDTYPKLTLKSLQQIGSDGSSGLPAFTFGYNLDGGLSQNSFGGWNRLVSFNNGQGGVLSLGYANIATATGNSLFTNRHRVIAKTMTDGRGNSPTWFYHYQNPRVIGVIADGNQLYVQTSPDGVNWQYPKTLFSSLAINTWYVVQIGIDDGVGFSVQVYKESSPTESNMFSTAMPAGGSWR